jgi:PHD/YefM family antitoxin component YafN of YafNO toxin-antitoxin module
VVEYYETMKTKTIESQGQADKLVLALHKAKRPILITEDGQPAAYLVEAGSFEQMQARVRLLEGIARGEMAVRQGRVRTHAQARKKMARWLN